MQTFIFGLGNPGKEYERTRHNVGFMLIDQLAEDWQVALKDQKKMQTVVGQTQSGTFLAKPTTFMNLSGQSVSAFWRYYAKTTPVTDFGQRLYVIHDDLDIALGSYKIMFGSGPKIHNGLLSIYDYLKTNQFWHVRIGVDGRAGDRSKPGSAYVLERFLPTELVTMQTVFKEITAKLSTLPT
jgi:peptidyl-tRNA hydrolase, PTH1 family